VVVRREWFPDEGDREVEALSTFLGMASDDLRRPLFLDTETTGLDQRCHDVWEVAVIRREDGIDTEYLWQVRPNLDTADPKALEIGRYAERFIVPDTHEAAAINSDGTLFRLSLPEFLFDLQDAVRDAVMVGSNPAFDDKFLTKLLQANNRKIGWRYRTIDIATFAAGHLYGRAHELTVQRGEPTFYGKAAALAKGFRSYDLSRAVGVEPPAKDVAHTALGDARWARDVYDAVTKPTAPNS
jgi:DNA polymerase III epsilon subunit-like protein